jgi:hypothetical protein
MYFVRGGMKLDLQYASAFFTEIGRPAPAKRRHVVDILTAVEMNLIQSRDNSYK